MDNNSCCAEFVQSDTYACNFAKSMVVYEEVKMHFTTKDGKFTDDFEGAFVDENGILNICIVGNRKPIKSDFLIYKEVNYSCDFFDSIAKELGNIMQEYTIWQVRVCEACNSVIACIENINKIPLVITYLKTNSPFGTKAMKFFVGENDILLN